MPLRLVDPQQESGMLRALAFVVVAALATVAPNSARSSTLSARWDVPPKQLACVPNLLPFRQFISIPRAHPAAENG